MMNKMYGKMAGGTRAPALDKRPKGFVDAAKGLVKSDSRRIKQRPKPA